MAKERNTADAYRKKAYEGDTKAMNNLGVCYERGYGVRENCEMAFEWYMKAASLDDVYGCFNVAECYYHGKGVAQDLQEAFQWYLKAAEKG
ncbi:MAG: sel1 repeat family protein, partial [Prevotella sp.]|nr:sel1 repeat family protein [Prevotella sp.]